MTLEEIEALLDTFSEETTDFIGQLPIDLSEFDFCNPDGNTIEQPAMTLEEIEALCNSDFIQNLLDIDTMKAKVQNMINGGTDDLGEIEGNYAIIEFGDDYVKGDKVEYTLKVSPGQSINGQTIIGSVIQNNINKPLKSIFTKGKILSASDNNKEFLHLYPSKANRHIIIADYSIDDSNGYDEKAFTKIGDEINNNTDLYNFIKDNICLSTLPLFLNNHETKKEHANCIITPTGSTCKYQNNPSAVKQYKDLMKKYEDILDKEGKKFKDIASAKNIKATGGKNSEMNKIKDAVLEQRENILLKIIDLYNYAKDINQTKKVPYYMNILSTIGYEDCFNLCNIEGDNTGYENINNKAYNNYYMYLLSQTDYDTNNEYIKRYQELLLSIIKKRSLYESSAKPDLIKEFNDLFKTHIRTYTADEIDNEQLGYNIVSTVSEISVDNIKSLLENENNITLQNAINKIVNDYIIIQDTENDYLNTKQTLINEFNQYYKSHIEFDIDTIDEKYKTGYSLIYAELQDSHDKEQIKEFIKTRVQQFNERPSSYTKQFIYKRLANIYLYINNLEDVDPNSEEIYEFTDDYTVYDLIQEEYKLLTDFWDTTIKAYQEKSIQKIIKGISDEADKLSQYAEWPTPTTITIEGQEYQHYLFQNPVHSINDADYDTGDDNANEYDENQIVEEPKETPDMSVSEEDAINALFNTDDDKDDIAITDTAYWVKYFNLATIISLPPAFWASGLDIPPSMTPVPMPGIYIAIKAIYIKSFNIVIVIGIAIRGIYVFPILLVVNLSDQDLSPLTPLIALLNKVKDMYKAGISTIEQTIPNIIGLLIYKLEKENEEYTQANQKYEAQLLQLQNLVVENDEKLKRNMKRLVDAKADLRQKIHRPAENNNIQQNNNE